MVGILENPDIATIIFIAFAIVFGLTVLYFPVEQDWHWGIFSNE